MTKNEIANLADRIAGIMWWKSHEKSWEGAKRESMREDGTIDPASSAAIYLDEATAVAETLGPVLAGHALLLAAAKIASKWIADELKEIGGCDHAVGICCCDDVAMLENFDAVIAKVETVSKEAAL